MARLTQKEVASYLGLTSTAQISRWERGERLPNLRHALRLAALYHRFVTDLFIDLFDEEREMLTGRQKENDIKVSK